MTTWLVTGAAGFIGYHLTSRLLTDGQSVVGIDDLSHTYDPLLTHDRLAQLIDDPAFVFAKADIADEATLTHMFERHRPTHVVHLAARTGVRASLRDPVGYAATNVVGFTNVIEHCRRHDVRHLVYASSSSVYGSSARTPFDEGDPAARPASVYAATKRAEELLAHAYGDAYGLRTTGLRLFTVYGAWGRPDMAYYRFAEAMLDGRPLTVHGAGDARRDFTYVDDVVESIVRVARAAAATQDVDRAPARVFNVGRGRPTTVSHLIDLLERITGRTAIRRHGDEQAGEVRATHADVQALAHHVGFTPQVTMEQGLTSFVDWLRRYRR
ncbi:MAG TPA: NAD-dependent epimerase/dehydratase family protein [Euzebyales bacterium]